MRGSSRRHFLQKSALVGLGAAAASCGIALGETEAETTLRGEDAELAGVLRSYGRMRAMVRNGTQKTVIGSRTRRVPAYNLEVVVHNRAAFCRSFEIMSRHCDRVMVQGNTLKLAREGRYFVIVNQIT